MMNIETRFCDQGQGSAPNEAAESELQAAKVSPLSIMDPEPIDWTECYSEKAAGLADPMVDAPVSVVIGSSSGGLCALIRFFSSWVSQPDIVMFVIHDVPDEHLELINSLIRLQPNVDVVVASDGIVVVPGCIYVSQPGLSTDFQGQPLTFRVREGDTSTQPINVLFSSVAQRVQHRAVGVLLSGTGADATSGLERIRRCGGLTFIQDPGTAACADMPMRAISAALADRVLNPETLAIEIGAICRTLCDNECYRSQDNGALQRLLAELTQKFHVDFRHYKPEMISRRVDRRMRLMGMPMLEDYLLYVQHEARELEALYADILIPVTEFFRDAEAFWALSAQVLSTWSQDKKIKRRIWVAACATGEEAYSIAIQLAELFGEQGPSYQVFATDVEPRRIERARAGWFPRSSARGLTQAIIDRYFVQSGHGIQVHPSIRRHVVFSCHDLLGDVPLHGMDLVTCRNVLIYFRPNAQLHVLKNLLAQLEPGAALMLGSSESLPNELDLARDVLDHRSKIYRRSNHPILGLSSDEFLRQITPQPEGGRRPDTALAKPWRGREEDDLVVANEELRAMNEELVIARKQFTTIKSDSSRQLTKLDELDIDLSCMLHFCHLAVVFIDEQLKPTRFTCDAGRLLGISPLNAWLPLDRLEDSGLVTNIADDVLRAFDSMVPVARIVIGNGMSRHVRHIQPYRRSNGGKAAMVEFTDAGPQLESLNVNWVLDTAPSPVALLDAIGVIIFANQAWLDAIEAFGNQGLLSGQPGQVYLEACAQAPTSSQSFTEDCNGIEAILNGGRLCYVARHAHSTSLGFKWTSLTAASLEPAGSGCIVWLQDLVSGEGALHG